MGGWKGSIGMDTPRSRRTLLTLLLTSLLAPGALATMYIQPEHTFANGASGPTDYYRSQTTGAYYHYDASYGTLTPAPLFSSSRDLYVLGLNVTVHLSGEQTQFNASRGAFETCERTFCVLYQARFVGDWNVTYQYEFWGWHDGFERRWDGAGLMNITTGRPTVTGGSTWFNQTTLVEDCQLVVRMSGQDRAAPNNPQSLGPVLYEC